MKGEMCSQCIVFKSKVQENGKTIKQFCGLPLRDVFGNETVDCMDGLTKDKDGELVFSEGEHKPKR